MLKQIKILKYTDEDKKRLSLHNPENYLTVIIQNYYYYNWRARLDVAETLYEKWIYMRKNYPATLASQKNLFLEIYSKFFQVCEDLALIGTMLLYDSKTSPAYLKFVDGKNSDISAFYKMAHDGFSDQQLLRIMGLDRLDHFIKSNKMKLGQSELENYSFILKESIKTEAKNLKMNARLFLVEAADESSKKKLIESGTYKVHNSIKHGFKLIHPTNLALQLWEKIEADTVNVIHEGLSDETSGKTLMSLGGFGQMDENITDHIMNNLRHYSDEIHLMCEMWLAGRKNPMFLINRLRFYLTKDKQKKGEKVGVNQHCLCGSGIKYKKCCKKFEYEYKLMDLLNYFDIKGQ